MKKDFPSYYLLAFIGLLGLYFYSGPTTLPDCDAGEFTLIAIMGGIAHPPGYPLYCSLLRLFGLFHNIFPIIPLLSLLSMIFSVGAAYLLFKTLTEYSKNPEFSLITSILIFTSGPIWRASTAIEPFALNLLLASLCIRACWKLITLKGSKEKKQIIIWSILLGISFGASLCNHHTMAFLLPFAVIVLIYNTKAIIPYIFGCFLGVIPLIYFVFQDYNQIDGIVWGGKEWYNFWPRLYTHLLRKEYGTFTLKASGGQGSWYMGPILFLKNLPISLSGVFLVAAITDIFKWMKNSLKTKDIFKLGIFISVILTGIIFTMLFKEKDNDSIRFLIERFYALPIFLTAPFVCDGLIFIWSFIKKSQRTKYILAVFCLLFHIIYQWQYSERRTETFYEAHVKNIFSTIEHNSVLLTLSDSQFYGALYGKYVLHLDDSVDIIGMGLLTANWYLDQVLKKLRLPYDKNHNEFKYYFKKILKYRPVYSTIFRSYLENVETMSQAKGSYPIGPLLKLVDDPKKIHDPYTLMKENKILYNKLILPSYQTFLNLNPWEKYILAIYAQTWQSLKTVFKQIGDDKSANQSLKFEEYFTPLKYQ